MPFLAHRKTADECLEFFDVESVTTGLSDEQVAAQTKLYGKNALAQEDPTPLWKLVVEQFDDLLVQILLGAAVLSFILAFFEGDGEELSMAAFVEPAVILIILVLNAIVGVWQESNAEAALEALKKMQPQNARCTRGGRPAADVPAEDLVPGDIVEIKVGDRVPADCRILKFYSSNFRSDEAALTGETATVAKMIDALPPPKNDRYQTHAKKNMVFSGTTISMGSAVAIVVKTGQDTEIGSIHTEVMDTEDDKTPLTLKLDEFGERLTKVIGLICTCSS